MQDLVELGIRGRMLNCLNDFMTNRSSALGLNPVEEFCTGEWGPSGLYS